MRSPFVFWKWLQVTAVTMKPFQIAGIYIVKEIHSVAILVLSLCNYLTINTL